MMQKYTEENPLRVFTTFSGYDSQCLALKKAGIPFDLVGWSEIDENACIAHNVLFPEYKDRNYGDICKIDWNTVPDFDLFTYSSPCTDFSIAGLQLGGEEGSGTRSSLLWECKKAIEIKKPKYLMFENVKALLSNKFIKLFDKWCYYLNECGYTNFYKIINSRDYGVPQARKRIFMISILDTGNDDLYFEFPQKIKLKKTVYDILEKNVNEKYYINQDMVSDYIDTVEIDETLW